MSLVCLGNQLFVSLPEECTNQSSIALLKYVVYGVPRRSLSVLIIIQYIVQPAYIKVGYYENLVFNPSGRVSERRRSLVVRLKLGSVRIGVRGWCQTVSRCLGPLSGVWPPVGRLVSSSRCEPTPPDPPFNVGMR